MRYWVYKDAQMMGPMTPEEISRMPGASSDLLLCLENSDGSHESDWKTAGEFEDMSELIRGTTDLSSEAVGAGEYEAWPVRDFSPEELLGVPYPQMWSPWARPPSLERRERPSAQAEEQRKKLSELEAKVLQYEQQQNSILDRLAEKEKLLAERESEIGALRNGMDSLKIEMEGLKGASQVLASAPADAIAADSNNAEISRLLADQEKLLAERETAFSKVQSELEQLREEMRQMKEGLAAPRVVEAVQPSFPPAGPSSPFGLGPVEVVRPAKEEPPTRKFEIPSATPLPERYFEPPTISSFLPPKPASRPPVPPKIEKDPTPSPAAISSFFPEPSAAAPPELPADIPALSTTSSAPSQASSFEFTSLASPPSTGPASWTPPEPGSIPGPPIEGAFEATEIPQTTLGVPHFPFPKDMSFETPSAGLAALAEQRPSESIAPAPSNAPSVETGAALAAASPAAQDTGAIKTGAKAGGKKKLMLAVFVVVIIGGLLMVMLGGNRPSKNVKNISSPAEETPAPSVENPAPSPEGPGNKAPTAFRPAGEPVKTGTPPPAAAPEPLPVSGTNPAPAPSGQAPTVPMKPEASPKPVASTPPEGASGQEPAGRSSQDAIELVKKYQLGGGRGNIASWLQYSFLTPGHTQKWAANPGNAPGTYFVQYQVSADSEKSENSEPYVYIFEVNLENQSVQGFNRAAKELFLQEPPKEPAKANPPVSRPKTHGRKNKKYRASGGGGIPLLPLPGDNELMKPR